MGPSPRGPQAGKKKEEEEQQHQKQRRLRRRRPSMTPQPLQATQAKLRALVSKKKRRYREDGFDLDLSYVTPRILAMGFPATNYEATYRNSAVEVEDFLESHHGGTYKVYNLCSERSYPASTFHGRVARYPMDDHTPPPLGMIAFFCKDLETLLQQPDAAAAVHCKAGKGRTGVMICSYLLWSGEWDDPEEALRFYAFARTNNQKGITIPSQRRFVHYFHKTLPPKKIEDEDGERLSAWGEKRSFLRQLIDEAALDLDEEGLDDDDGEEEDDEEEEDDDESSERRHDSSEEDQRKEEEEEKEQPTTTEEEGKPSELADAAAAASAALSAAGNDRRGAAPDFESIQFLTFAGKRGDAPIIRRAKEKLLNDEWNRLNRLKLGRLPPPKLLAVWKIVLHKVRPNTFRGTTFEPRFRLQCADFEYTSTALLASSRTTSFKAPLDKLSLTFPKAIVVDEVFVAFYNKRPITGKKDKAFKFWFHTAFIQGNRLHLDKADLDTACKDTKHQKFDEHFAVDLFFTDAFHH